MLRFGTPILLIVLCIAFSNTQSEYRGAQTATLTPVVFKTTYADDENGEQAQKEYEALDAEFQSAMAKFTERVKAITDKQEQLLGKQPYHYHLQQR